MQSVEASQLQPGDIISLTLYGNIGLPTVNNGTLLAISLPERLANPGDAMTNHSNIYPSVPTGRMLDNYKSYSYLAIKLSDNSIIEIGIPWIVSGGLYRAIRGTIVATIVDVDETDKPNIIEALKERGYNNITVTLT